MSRGLCIQGEDRMRVIAGSAKRLQLRTLDGLDTRPTTDRIKETLFNMIDPWLADCDFLDLFAGSGGIGIEALSRGAGEAVFIEKNPKAMSVIRDNLKHTRLDGRAVTLQMDVIAGLVSLNGRKQFDYIFMDPPYDHLLEKRVLETLRDMELLKEDGMIIVEASLDTGFDYLGEMGYTLVKEKKYKTNKHMFIEISDL
ncbi:MAG: 16S rRNA (guanine(966)-N(2))-methyltransferase RsmD [Eubacteriales bacterium]|nr:16S rRNA (guanine(966)-N(2))-methyltransferase RsmD [Eubacteriales bacterium]